MPLPPRAAASAAPHITPGAERCPAPPLLGRPRRPRSPGSGQDRHRQRPPPAAPPPPGPLAAPSAAALPSREPPSPVPPSRRTAAAELRHCRARPRGGLSCGRRALGRSRPGRARDSPQGPVALPLAPGGPGPSPAAASPRLPQGGLGHQHGRRHLAVPTGRHVTPRRKGAQSVPAAARGAEGGGAGRGRGLGKGHPGAPFTKLAQWPQAGECTERARLEGTTADRLFQPPCQTGPSQSPGLCPDGS